jgi:hypothetical protein
MDILVEEYNGELPLPYGEKSKIARRLGCSLPTLSKLGGGENLAWTEELKRRRQPSYLPLLPDEETVIETDSQARTLNHVNNKLFVYFIEGAGLVKIGRSVCPNERLKFLQRGSPVQLTLLAVIEEANGRREAQLHRKFASYRKHGEWFSYVPEIEKYINQCKQSGLAI